MKIKRLVGLLADLTPHAYSDSVVLMWLSNCENSILTDVFLVAPSETAEYEEVTEQALLVPHPYDKLYLPYLQAQVAHANQEYDLYANLMALYNAYRYEYAQYIVHGADPGSGDAVRRGYYLSAYGIAVAHGYTGTEAEWIASLKGAAGAKGETGEPGKSAYEVALDQGFEGTEAEWIESLRGAAGRVAVYGEAPVDGLHYEAAVEGLVVEAGLEILLTVASTNQGAATLAINGGEAYPLCYRPGYFSGSNYLRPELRMPFEAEMLLRGAEYVFRFDGYSWILQSFLALPDEGGCEIPAQDEEPEAEDGALWIDTDAEPESAGYVTTEVLAAALETVLETADETQKAYTDAAIAEALSSIGIAEEGAY